MKILITITLLALTSSCATIFTGTDQTITIQSEPSGATVKVNGIDRGTTPLPVVLKKGSEGQVLTIELEGYETQSLQPTTVFNVVSVFNFFSVFGWGVDAISGALWVYDPILYDVVLEVE